MRKETILREDVLNCPLTFKATTKRDADLIQQVLQAVMNYVRSIPPAGVVGEPEVKKPIKRTARKKT